MRMVKHYRARTLQVVAHLYCTDLRLPASQIDLQQIVLLQFFAQGIAVNAQHVRRMRLVAVGTFHHCFQYRLFDSEYHHLIHIRWQLLAQIPEIFFQALFNDLLDIVFAHGSVTVAFCRSKVGFILRRALAAIALHLFFTSCCDFDNQAASFCSAG